MTQQTTRPDSALSPDDWAVFHDALVLAHDALGKTPEEVDPAYLSVCCADLRSALRRVGGAA